jgi:threonine/homoserine/homoserine lactone efflux protein
MPLAELFLAMLALLATPGPTNALLALAAAQRGLAAALALIPVVLGVYLAVILPLTLWGAAALQAVPVLQPLVAGLAALWVARLALRLWHLPPPGPGPGAEVSAAAIALTTALNPKAPILGLVLLPGTGVPGVGGLVAAVTLVSVLWAALGAGLLARLGRGLNRAAALWLAALSLVLAARAMAG